MKYFYFISYYFTFNSIHSGFGSLEVSSDKEINAVDELRELEKIINKNINEEFETTNGKSTIINYQLLRKEKTNDKD